MDVHEYQAKEVLARYGVRIPRGGIAYSPEQASYRTREIGGSKWVVKAQIHSGARGKAGGIKLGNTDREVWQAAHDMFGKKLVTQQTGPRGKAVYRVYVEEAKPFDREIYFGLVLDRRSERVMVIASAAGGMEIEEIAVEQPDSILRLTIDPAVGMQPFQARELAFGLGLDASLVEQASSTFLGCYKAFAELDATMIEINPLVVTSDSQLVALDAKMSFDDNAVFRHPQISEFRDKSQEDARETYALDRGLSYVGLDGDIGCIINGAGLAMATMDMIMLEGASPANFLDIGGGASPERVVQAFKAVLADDNVKVLLVNIFAGINRCDWVAAGVVKAVEELKVKVPVVVRLAGTNVEEGRRILRESRVDIITAETLRDAARHAVAARKAGRKAI